MKRLTVDEIARKLARHPELVRRWLREGRLRGERIGWSWTSPQPNLTASSARPPDEDGADDIISFRGAFAEVAQW